MIKPSNADQPSVASIFVKSTDPASVDEIQDNGVIGDFDMEDAQAEAKESEMEVEAKEEVIEKITHAAQEARDEEIDWDDSIVKKMKKWKKAKEQNGSLKWPWLECSYATKQVRCKFCKSFNNAPTWGRWVKVKEDDKKFTKKMNTHSGRTNQGKENAGQTHRNNIETLNKRKEKQNEKDQKFEEMLEKRREQEKKIVKAVLCFFFLSFFGGSVRWILLRRTFSRKYALKF